MKKGTNLVRRVLSFIMAFALILTCVPAVALAADAGTTLYLLPGAWNVDGARFAAYFFGNGDKWVSMTDSDGDGYYEVNIPEGGYTNVIFCRMNGSTTENNWDNKWNQTQNLTFDGNCYSITGWGEADGNWSTYIPVTPSTTSVNLYLKPNANWLADGARFAMYYYHGSEYGWTDLTDTDGDGYYEGEVPAGYAYVIFCRMNPSNTENRWNNESDTDVTKALWNQTNNLALPTDGTNCYTVADDAWSNGDGTWSTYTPEVEEDPDNTTVTYYVMGSENLCGVVWQIDEDKPMALNTDGLYEVTYTNVPDGDHEFRVTTDGTEKNSWGVSEGGNYAVTLETASDVTITFNSETKEITVSTKAVDGGSEGGSGGEGGTGEENEPYYVAGTSNLCGSSWSANDAANQMTYNSEGLCVKTYESVYPGSFEFKITDGTWDNSWGKDGGQANYTFKLEAICNVTITFNPDTKAITVTTEETGETLETVKYKATLHFANTVNWTPVNLYSWTADDVKHSGEWPGTALSVGTDGYYTATVEYEYYKGKGLSFIFSSGNSQTVDLVLDAGDFEEVEGVYTAEKWIAPTGSYISDNKTMYYAVVVDSANAIVTSPVVAGSSVTFNYYNETATSVYVAGSFNSWSETANQMKKGEDGVWTATIENLDAGDYQYKFLVDGNWITDPMNGNVVTNGDNQNSTFSILNSGDEKDPNKITINVHYTRSDGNYDGWNLWVWGSAIAGHQVDFEKTDDDGSKVATIVLEDARAHSSISFKERLSVEGNEWKEQGDSDRTIDLSTIVSGTIDYYIPSGKCTYGDDVVRKNKVSNVSLNYDTGVVTFTTAQQIADPATEVTLVIKVEGETETTVKASVNGVGTTCALTLKAGAWDLKTLYQYKIKYQGFTYDIGIDAVYASEKFATEYTYTGKDLGATWSANSTAFKVWAPTAEAVSVKLYDLSNKVYTARETTYPMTAEANGTWAVTINGDLNGVYYNYLVTVDGKTVEAVDPYARTTGVNGEIGMVIDLDSTDPTGWASDVNPNKITSYTDAVIYELHVRDFSIDDSSGMSNKGKYLAFTEKGTTVPNTTISTGIDYLKNLGVTHLHLLPVYDYGSVDESRLEEPQFNWGYDPVNYNTPEGSYSTDPYNGETRVNEFKQMVKSLHDHDISVIMDVVYNHVYDADKFCFNNIVPGYFSRVDSNRSGCGNDTASEREMVRKYIVESVLYWHQEYHIDGFRFDLVGLLDTETINQIVKEVHDCCSDVIFYGEGWDMDDTNKEPGTEMAKQGNASKTPGFAYFSDSMRNGIGGSNGTSTGFASGAGNGTSMVSEWLGNPWWTSNPQQVVQYASCHDNYTLIDKLILSTGASEITDDIISMNNLAAVYYMTAQGIPFIHAGEEMLREKLEKDGGRCENSYNASDYVNHIEWSNLGKGDYADTSAYYQGLIEFRKAHPALRYDTAAKVSANVKNRMSSANVVAFQIDGYAAGDTDDIYIIFNAGTSATTVTLPTGTWTININKADAGTEPLGTASGSVSVDGISAMVLTKADEGKDSASSSGTVTLYFTNNKSWSNVYAYAWDVNGNHVTAAWPGTEMTWVENNSFGQDVYSVTLPASATGVVFNGGGDDTKTGDLEVGVDGTGYYFNDEGVIVSYKYRDPIGGGSGSADDYYLFGWINNANYACEENASSTGDYKFEDGTVTATFKTDSYVGVKTGDNGTWYMTDGWMGSVTSATLYNTSDLGTDADKLMVPGGVEVTFTLVENADGTLTLSYEAEKDTNSYSATDKSGIQNGVTLHCWNWSFAEIEANMASIAAQGYTAIQTSPVQPMKETTTDSDKTVKSHWWVYYQPVDFKINDVSGNALGTKTELVSMIETAHQYGVKVIVDVVANHLANETNNDLSTAIPDTLRDTAYWHDITTNTADWTDRYDLTQHCMGGLPDLNTGNDAIQGMVLDFLKECIDAGVDGFRFDAAKHIETPEDASNFASDFWPTVIGGAEEYAKSKGKDIYCYGETLDSWKGLPVSAYTKYMAITDNTWSNTLRENISGGTAAMVSGYDKAAAAYQLVLWAESHDTYADGSSADETENEVNKTWALVAARADAMGLYLARPAAVTQSLGTASETGWANAEVKAVNDFHDAFAGQSEYIDTEDGIVYVERGISGVVLVNASGTTATVAVAANKIADGTYTDQITGNTFTVANGTISGKIGDTGIAVVYNTESLIDLEGATMTLGNSLAMNFVIDTAKLNGDGHKAVIMKEYADGRENKVVTVAQSEWKLYEDKLYYFTFEDIAAKEMTDDVCVLVYNSKGELVTNLWRDSVRDYCMRAIKAEETNNNAAKLALYVDMLNYGAGAQAEFDDYHADDLAISKLTETQKGYATKDEDAVAENNQTTAPGTVYKGSTLLLESQIKLNFVFAKSDVTKDMYAVATYTNHYGKDKSVTIQGEDFHEYNDECWYISVTDMSVADGEKLVTLTLYNADGTETGISANDSVESYVARANEDTNGTNPLYTLIFKFTVSAYNYFH